MGPGFEESSSVISAGLLGAINRFITKQGLATLFALVLLALVVWMGVFKLPDAMGSTAHAEAQQIDALSQKLDAHDRTMAADRDESRQQQRDTLTLMRLVCINTARGNHAAEELCKAVGQ